jgi:hypothetical protein
MEQPDSGTLAVRKRLQLTYVEQDSRLVAGANVRTVVERAMQRSVTSDSKCGTHFPETLGPAGFEDLEV